MKIARTKSELERNINNALINFLQTDFRDFLEETEIKMAYKYVYSYHASESAMNRRRMENGGLIDRDNMKTQLFKNNNQILFYNNTQPQGKTKSRYQIAIPIEEGSEKWNMDKAGPRPFVTETLRFLEKSNKTYQVFHNYFKNTKKIK